MRITRAYTITPEVKRILDTKPNKSEYICRAVRKLHVGEEAFSYQDIETKRLWVLLFNRMDEIDPLKALVLERINSFSS